MPEVRFHPGRGVRRHDLNAYLQLLKLDGTMCWWARRKSPPGGCVQPDHEAPEAGRLGDRGIRETQEMLDFCAEKGITADIELIPIQQINEAYERLLKSDVKYRFVIDMASLR